MNKFLDSINDIGSLCRINLAPLTISVPIFGAFTVNKGLSPWELFLLGSIGLCAHIFGFVLNDVIDFSIDKYNMHRQKRPLVNGRINRKQAICLLVLPVIVALFIFIWALSGSFLGSILLGISILFSVIYNLFSKRGPFPRIMAELSLALSISLLCLCGALLKTNVIPVYTIVFCMALLLILLLVNSVSSHLKDIKYDSQSNAASFVLSMGTRMLGEDAVCQSRKLWVYSFVIQLAILALIFVLALFNKSFLLVRILALSFVVYAGLHLRMLLSLKSFNQIRQSLPLLGGGYNYAALSLLVSPSITGLGSWIYWPILLILILFPFFLARQVWQNPYRRL